MHRSGPTRDSVHETQQRLRTLAIRLAHVANSARLSHRLSAYALIVREQPERREAIGSELQQLAEEAHDEVVAAVLQDAAQVVLDLLATGPAGDASANERDTSSRSGVRVTRCGPAGRF